MIEPDTMRVRGVVSHQLGQTIGEPPMVWQDDELKISLPGGVVLNVDGFASGITEQR
ncbi:MAG: hypothetical protein IT370_12685 [Deltaproteobacteria bacterium]|nr:hypothetical protein [Deltaproteobacteria bacterium]